MNFGQVKIEVQAWSHNRILGILNVIPHNPTMHTRKVRQIHPRFVKISGGIKI